MLDPRRFAFNANFNANPVAPTVPVPPPAATTPAPTTPGGPPAPTSPNPWVNRAATEAWFRSRSGTELYNLFQQIYGRNQMAGRAFWDQVVGRGHGENDLQAMTIHKMFGGDMNAYNNWRNQLHYSGQENQLGNFDLMAGTWNNGGITDGWGWDSVGVGKWDPAYLPLGLQSTPGHEADGAEAWKTYGAGQYFDPFQGARYAPPALQAQFAAGQVPGYNTAGQAIPGATPSAAPSSRPPAAPSARMNNGSLPGAEPRVPVPTPANNGVPTSVAPTVSTPANPGGGGARPYSFQPTLQRGWR